MVEVFDGDVVVCFPGVEAAAAFGGPVIGFVVGIFFGGDVGIGPVYVGEVFDEGVGEDDVGAGAALGVACLVLTKKK